TSQLPTGDLVLRVGGQQITATADIPIQQGARLQLEVSQLQPIPTLRILTPVANPAVANVGGTLQLLPGNSSGIASPPLASVVQAVQSSQLAVALPSMLAESVAQLLKQVSRPAQLSQPATLAAIMRDSGIFLESGLQASLQGRPPATDGDFKAGLFRTLAQVEAALARIQAAAMPASDAEALLDMKRELEAGLGRITLHQLNSQPVEAQGSRHWQFEIPVQLGDSVHSVRIDIDRDGDDGSKSPSDSDEDCWRVKLQLQPGALGALEIALQLQGDTLSLRIAAANNGARPLIDAGMPSLVRVLESRGITLTTSPTAALLAKAPPTDTPGPGAALDVRA
ncbi:MAG: flagellar hook-length control protein FliK, partial [Congregibacter sp.]|nr:flagellar hook-length control protein FliK [Congregibacter sp.]